MKSILTGVLLFAMMFATTSYAQINKEAYEIQLKSGTFTPKEAVLDLAQQPEKLSDVLFQDNYHVVVQFKTIPNNTKRRELANSGIQLLAYLGANAYQATISKDIHTNALTKSDIRAWSKMPIQNKIAPVLQKEDLPNWAVSSSNTIELTLILPKNTPEILQHLQNADCEILGNALGNPRHVEVRTNVDNINTLAALPFVDYVEPIREPDAKLMHYSTPSMRVGPLTADFLGDQQCTGRGVTIGIGDGGLIVDHVDFENRVNNKTVLDLWGAHSYHVAGIAAGTGNINPWHKGIAYRSNLIMDITSNIIQNAPNLHAQGMSVTNNSYGPSNFSCTEAGGYNSTSQNIDIQMLDMPELMHVIAAGNSGYVTCSPYPDGFGTVLKSYSSNKNALVVSSTSHRGNGTTFSSRGPVADGRLKPDIAAPGANILSTGNDFNYVMISGSSMAAPAVAGVWSLLVESFRKTFNSEPKSALLKAYLLNTTNDIGNPGPDYTFGYGMPNVARADKALREERYFNKTIGNGQSFQHTIQVPNDAAEVRVMLYWHDKEGVVGNTKALVNDLQLTVQAPNNAIYDPWILDHAPANVENNATRGIDNLNNVEQVTLSTDTPGELVPGTYVINVIGTQIPQGPQEYFLVYEVIKKGVELVYPVGGETFMPGAREFFRWDAAGPGKNNVSVQYSVNDGITWEKIATDPAHVKAGYVDFTFPADIEHTDKGRVKITINNGADSDINEYPFVIMQQPTLETPESCGGKIYLNWDDIKGATSYEIMRLDTFMKPLAVTNATSYIINNLPAGSEEWYSVRPVNAYGQRGYRAIAQKGVVSTAGCSLVSDVRVKRIITPLTSTGREFANSSHSPNQTITVEIENKGNTPVDNFDVSFALNGNTLVTDRFSATIQPGEVAPFTFGFGKDFSMPGVHELTAKTQLSGDTNPANDQVSEPTILTQLANPPVAAPIDIVESFDDLTTSIVQSNQKGVGGEASFDFQSSNPNGELIIGTEFSEAGASVTLNNVADGIAAVNELIITKNLSNYTVLNDNGKIPMETLFLSFQYRNHQQEANPSNRVFVRGSENDNWLQVYNLDNHQALSAGVFSQTNSLNVVATLRNNGQDFSTTFQIKFSQSGKSSADDPLNSDGLTFDNLELKEGIELPVELASFEVNKTSDERDALVSWRTFSETNNAFFIVEVATENSDGQMTDFKEIHRVAGAGTTVEVQHYEYIDTEANKSTTRYYRLKQVDFSAAFAYSAIKTLDFSDEERDVISVYPVPFKEDVHVTVKSKPGASLKIRVSDMSGRLIQEQHTELQTEGTHKATVNMNSTIPSGMYLLQVDMDEYSHSKKIIKQE